MTILPASARARGSTLVEQPVSQSLAGISILVVDDVQDVREILQALLEDLGAVVALASDGREALDMIRPDVILCDLVMPRMDGFEFMAESQTREAVRPPAEDKSELVFKSLVV
jgi:CheY-like chemotaxis protein